MKKRQKTKKTLGQRFSSWYLVLVLLFIYLPIGYILGKKKEFVGQYHAFLQFLEEKN